MAFAHSQNSRVLLNEDHVSASINGYAVTHSRDYGESTTLVDTGCKYIPGLASGSLAIKGLFDAAVGGLHEEVNAIIGTDNSALWTVLPDGDTIGKPALIVNSDIQGYTVDASVKDVVSLTIDAMPDDGVDIGVSLHAQSAETADGNGASVNNLASSANGGVASLHVTVYSGLTNDIIKVQHSTNDSVWVDLITFTTVTGVTSERKTVTGTVNQYLRASWDVTGTGTNTFVVAFARR